MTTNETIMEEMLNRATNNSGEVVDELSLQMFCLVVKSNPKLVDRAQEMIMLKIRSNNVAESIKAISLLEECMTKCGPEFQDEASKFRFLNQLIRLVSKKYQGADTPIEIKKRIMECLLLWTTEFPQKSKIREVYDMLCRDDGVVHGTTTAIEVKRESTLGIDEEMFSKLIKSKNPEDYKRANLLIQNRVKQDARRIEFETQCINTLQGVKTTVSVLDDMLKYYENEGNREDRQSETMIVMHEVYQACKKHKTFMERLPALIESFDEHLTADAVNTNDSLQDVLKRYKSLVGSPTRPLTNSNNITNEIKSTADIPVKSTNADLLSDLLGDEAQMFAAPIPVAGPTPTLATTSTSTSNNAAAHTAIDELDLLGASANLTNEKVGATTKNSLDDINSIFDAATPPNMGESLASKKTNDIYSNLEILEPINVFPPPAAISSSDNHKQSSASGKGTYRKLPEIDKLSEDLFQKSLQDLGRVYSFKKGSEKLTLNDLSQEKNKPQVTSLSPLSTLSKVSEIEVKSEKEDYKKPDENVGKDDDDLILSTKDEEDAKTEATISANEKSTEICKAVEIEQNPPNKIRHLADVDIDLDEIVPSSASPLTLNGDDITLSLNYTENRIIGCKQVSVIVISANNKSKSLVNNFKFDAGVRKPCKVRVLQPTATTMQPCKPFRPSTPINQVMLLLNPTGKPIDVTCIIEYQLDDDPDPIKESMIARSIPYVE